MPGLGSWWPSVWKSLVPVALESSGESTGRISVDAGRGPGLYGAIEFVIMEGSSDKPVLAELLGDTYPPVSSPAGVLLPTAALSRLLCALPQCASEWLAGSGPAGCRRRSYALALPTLP